MEEARRVPKTHPPIQTADGPKRSAQHRMNWIDAIRERSKTTCPFEYAERLTETMLLGVVALRTGQGKRIHYDGEAGRSPMSPRPTSTSVANLARDGSSSAHFRVAITGRGSAIGSGISGNHPSFGCRPTWPLAA